MRKTNQKTGKKNRAAEYIRDCRDLLLLAYRQRPSILATTLGSALISAAFPFVNIIFSAHILDRLLAGGEDVMGLVCWMVGLNFLLGTGSVVLEWLGKAENQTVHSLTAAAVAEKCLSLDYQQLENPEIMNKKALADQGSNASGGMRVFIEYFSYLCSNTLSVAIAVATVSRIFVPGTLAPDAPNWARMLNTPWAALALLALVVALGLACIPIQGKANEKFRKMYEHCMDSNRRLSVFGGMVTNYALGKDVRTYDMSGVILEEQKRASEEVRRAMDRCTMEGYVLWNLGNLLNTAPVIAAYAFVGLKAMAGLISVGTLTMQVGAITAFSTAINGVIINIGELDLFRSQIKLYTEFLAIPSERYNGTLPVEKRCDGEFALEFRDVSFRYPNQEQWSLRHVSCKLPLRGKIAIVGPNGAGKTTFIKLLCRLYDPQEGEILLNGIDIRKYDYKEYISLLSVVFQDFKLFSMGLGENVAADVDYDPERVWACLEKAGIRERAERMEKGLDTPLYQQEAGGVEISGGEAQKIAIARALYKDAPVVILDEPTAALDPVSEYEIYSRFGELVENKTSIYISHRMSSCKFCDEILVFDGGGIVQRGSHDALMCQTEGLYAKLWEAQAENYRAEERRRRKEAMA